MGETVENRFITKFLVEYAVKNGAVMIHSDKVLSHLGNTNKNVGILLGRSAQAFKNMGVSGKQLYSVLNHLSNNWSKLGLSYTRHNKNGEQLAWSLKNNTRRIISQESVLSKVTKNMSDIFQPVAAGTAGWNKANLALNDSLKLQGRNTVDIYLTSKKFMKSMGDLGIGVNKDGQFINLANNSLMKMDEVTNKAARYSMRRFHAAALSMMFIGQGLSKTFGGMIKSVLGATGIFDAFRGILMGILLPILMPLIQKWLPKIIDWLKDPAHREFVGRMIIFLAVLGSIISTVAILIVLFGSLGWAWDGFAVLFKGFAGASVMGKFLIAIKGILAPLLILLNIWEAFNGFLEGDTMKILLGVTGVIAGLVALFVGGIPAAIALSIAALTYLGNKFAWVRGVIMTIVSPIFIIYNAIKKIIEWVKTGSLSTAHSNAIARSDAYWKNVGENLAAGGGAPVKMASGGIVSKPTLALIGESGPEAVVPLSNNTNNTVNFSPTFNISGSGFNASEADKLASLVNERLSFQMRRFNGGF